MPQCESANLTLATVRVIHVSVRTKFLPFVEPVAFGDYLDGWRVGWIGGRRAARHFGLRCAPRARCAAPGGAGDQRGHGCQARRFGAAWRAEGRPTCAGQNFTAELGFRIDPILNQAIRAPNLLAWGARGPGSNLGGPTK